MAALWATNTNTGTRRPQVHRLRAQLRAVLEEHTGTASASALGLASQLREATALAEAQAAAAEARLQREAAEAEGAQAQLRGRLKEQARAGEGGGGQAGAGTCAPRTCTHAHTRRRTHSQTPHHRHYGPPRRPRRPRSCGRAWAVKLQLGCAETCNVPPHYKHLILTPAPQAAEAAELRARVGELQEAATCAQASCRESTSAAQRLCREVEELRGRAEGAEAERGRLAERLAHRGAEAEVRGRGRVCVLGRVARAHPRPLFLRCLAQARQPKACHARGAMPQHPRAAPLAPLAPTPPHCPALPQGLRREVEELHRALQALGHEGKALRAELERMQCRCALHVRGCARTRRGVLAGQAERGQLLCRAAAAAAHMRALTGTAVRMPAGWRRRRLQAQRIRLLPRSCGWARRLPLSM